MTTILTKLTEALAALLPLIDETRVAIYAEANKRKQALIEAIADMQEAKDVMREFVDLTGSFADNAEANAEDMDISEDYVSEMLSDMNVFQLPIEQFDDYCEQCGKEMTRDEDQYMDEDGDGFMCEACDKLLHDDQMTFEELAESVE
jgi:NAD-dependent SIR2 family protein deacetylase